MQQCECGKRGYHSENAARRAHRNVSWRVRTYRCPQSGMVHVTNDEKRW